MTPSKKLKSTMERSPRAEARREGGMSFRSPEEMLQEAMVKHEIDRQVALDYEKEVTEKILTSMRSNPNTELQLL